MKHITKVFHFNQYSKMAVKKWVKTERNIPNSLKVALGLVILTLLFIFHFWNQISFYTRSEQKFSKQRKITEFNSSIYEGRCSKPPIPIFHKPAIEHYSKMQVKCAEEVFPGAKFKGVAFSVKNGNQLHRDVDLELMGLPCCYQAFFRVNETTIQYSHTCTPITKTVTEIPSHINFTDVICKDRYGKIRYRDTFPIVHPPKVETTPRNSNQLNFVIVGLDATSRLNFIRHMPLSNQYLRQNLDAISLDGYSVVGQGSHKNLVPLLTGQSYSEFVKGCAKSGQLDSCPFLWKQLSERRYITSFAEDWTNWNENWHNAFPKPPTSYYFTPYTIHMHKYESGAGQWLPSDFCYGTRLSFEVLLNFAESVTHVANKVNKPYFQYLWTGKLSHEKVNSLGLGDEALLVFLQNFKESQAWNNTVLLVIGDHGHMKVTEFYDTPEGQMEYRLPVAQLVLPPWFKKKYENKFQNLRENARKMLTTFDIHETLRDLMMLENLTNKTNIITQTRGISLFDEIPNRNCIQAGISLKWCNLCFENVPLEVNDPLVSVATQAILNEINNLSVKPLPDRCFEQTGKQVKKVLKWDTRDVYRELCNVSGEVDMGVNNTDFTTKLLQISCDPEKEIVDVVDIELELNPHGAIYHGQVMVITSKEPKKKNSRIILTDNVLRLDLYKYSGYCVPQHLKPYCICKDSAPPVPGILLLWGALCAMLVFGLAKAYKRKYRDT